MKQQLIGCNIPDQCPRGCCECLQKSETINTPQPISNRIVHQRSLEIPNVYKQDMFFKCIETSIEM